MVRVLPDTGRSPSHHPGLDPGSRFSFEPVSDSDACARYGLTRLVWADRLDDIGAGIAEAWRRAWKFALIECGNPEWDDLSTVII